MLRRHLVLGIGVVVVAALFAANVVAPKNEWVGAVEDLISGTAAVAAWIGVRRLAPSARRPWIYVALALTAWSLGDVVWDAYTFLGIDRPNVSFADVWYLSAYPLLAVGIISIARAHAGRVWRDGLLDGCIFAGAVAIVVWQFLVVPIAATTTSWFTSAVWSAYPLADALVLGALAFLVLAPGSHRRSTALLVGAMVTLLIVDFFYSFLPTVTSFNASHLDPLYPLGYVLLAAAVWVVRDEPATDGPPKSRMHPARFVLLAASLCAAAVVIIVGDTSAPTRSAYILFALVLIVLVISRFAAAIRAQELVQRKLEFRSSHDELTGVVSRLLLLDRIRHALDRADRTLSTLAVLYVDLDHFKAINDAYGHDVGDRVLVETTQRIRAALRPADTIGRLGGDEFVILCEDVTAVDAVRVGERIGVSIAEPMVSAKPVLQVSASIGIAVCEHGAATVDALVRDADTAMYEAKRAGGGRFEVCDVRVREAYSHRREIEEALREATTTGELVLDYQPVIRPSTGEVSGFEALLRWHRGSGTTMRPAEFISIAEETGAIVPIGAWVIDQVCAKLASWALDGVDAPSLSLNVSSLQFRNNALLNTVRRAVAHTGADPNRLVLEITESVLVREQDDVLGQLYKLRQIGVRIAIDDFGTGYSGLSYLHRLPVDIIKVDRSLTSELATDPAASIVLSSIIELAHALGFEIIAEGAETSGDVAMLRAMGCDEIQGYHFSRPLTAADADIVARNGLQSRSVVGSPVPTARPVSSD